MAPRARAGSDDEERGRRGAYRRTGGGCKNFFEQQKEVDPEVTDCRLF